MVSVVTEHGGDIYRNKVNIDFSVNTSPFGIPDTVALAVRESVSRIGEYPDPLYEELTHAIAESEGVTSQSIICGNGASELISIVTRALYRMLNEKAAVGVTAPSFSGYERAIKAISTDVSRHEVMLSADNDYEVTTDIIDRLFEDNAIVILGNPNNPTGRLIPHDVLAYACNTALQKGAYLVLDESFITLTEEYYRNDYETLYAQMDDAVKSHVIFIRSYTKSMSIPGIRMGYSIIYSEQLRNMVKAMLPEWNVSVPAMYAGIAASGMKDWLRRSVLDEHNGLKCKRVKMAEDLRNMGFRVYASDANFLLIQTNSNVVKSHKIQCTGEKGIDFDLYEALLQEGILIRKASNYSGLDDTYYRVAIKSDEDNQTLLDTVRKIFAKQNTCKDSGEDCRLDEDINDTGSEVINADSAIMNIKPADIERRSFEILTDELARSGIVLTGITAPVIKRCIHTTADFEYASTLMFSDNAVEIAQELIRNGAHIVTDTNMALAGINKKELARYGGLVHCYMADEDVAKEAKMRGITRASVSMERAAGLGKKVIIAVGNAPTALVTLCELIDKGQFVPDLVIGVPVGFVNVVTAKEMIMQRGIPYIVNRGRKGGSNVAAAICNAIMYEMR